MLLKNNSLWSFFSSVKLTITLLVLVVLVFIAATFLPSSDLPVFCLPTSELTIFLVCTVILMHKPKIYLWGENGLCYNDIQIMHDIERLCVLRHAPDYRLHVIRGSGG